MKLLESLESRRLFASSAAASSQPPAASASSAAVTPSAVASTSVFLTGNSMTDGVSYAGLAAMLGQKGTRSVELGRQTGSGFTQYANATLKDGYAASGIDPARPKVSNPWGNYQQAFAANPWDVLTIQPHERRFTTDIYGRGETWERNEAELPNSMNFLRAMAANNSRGQVFVYSRAARRTDVDADMNPTGQSFDYSKQWLRSYDESQPSGLAFFSRSAVQQFMPALRAAQDADAKTAKLPDVKLIPVGEAYYQIDQMIKAGKFAGTGITSILSLYRDQSHPTPDVAAYVIALSFYSSITGKTPIGVAPPGQYVQSNSPTADPKVQALLQQAVYNAITSSSYAGYTTKLGGSTTPTPPQPTPVGTASVRGFCFDDVNANGKFDAGDKKSAGKTVFLDADNDNTLDGNEQRVVTAADGSFAFTALAAGTVRVRRVFPNGWTASTTPITLTLAQGQGVTNVSIGSKPTSGTTPPPTTPTTPTPPTPTPPVGTAVFRGHVIRDLNANGVWDNSGEQGIGGRTVWVDLDNDGKLDAAEPKAVTTATGSFEFTRLAAGKVIIREVLPSGVRQTSPTNNAALTATLTAGQVKSGQVFLTT